MSLIEATKLEDSVAISSLLVIEAITLEFSIVDRAVDDDSEIEISVDDEEENSTAVSVSTELGVSVESLSPEFKSTDSSVDEETFSTELFE